MSRWRAAASPVTWLGRSVFLNRPAWGSASATISKVLPISLSGGAAFGSIYRLFDGIPLALTGSGPLRSLAGRAMRVRGHRGLGGAGTFRPGSVGGWWS
jgi:hypothetical protein